jgi:hypothetical protein
MKTVYFILVYFEKMVSLRANPLGMSEAIHLHKAGVFNLTSDAFARGLLRRFAPRNDM